MKPDILLPEPQTRREFCAHACQAATMLTGIAAGTWLSACGGSPTSPSSTTASPLTAVNASVEGRTLFVVVDAASALAATGGVATILSALGTFLVARTGQDTFTALTAICTHEGCTVNGFASQRFVCPCHGSEYTTSGAVAKGPAPQALRQYATQFANGILSFTV